MTAGTAQVVEDAVALQERTTEPPAGEMDTDGEVNLNGHYENGASVANEVPSISATRELRGILEALLFMSADPLPMNRIVSLLGAVSKQEVEHALLSLKHEYEQEGRGLHLAEIAGGYRILTKPDYAPWIKRLEKVKAPPRLSRSALESLAIIAYKQPIVRAEIEQIRGVETSGVLRTLLERKLVRIVGRKEEPGRPIMYGTTKFFLEHFGLRDLSQLPPLREVKELGESEQAMLPMDEEGDFQPALKGLTPSNEMELPLDAEEVGTTHANDPSSESFLADPFERA
jgi:segregation and condensation protein B